MGAYSKAKMKDNKIILALVLINIGFVIFIILASPRYIRKARIDGISDNADYFQYLLDGTSFEKNQSFHDVAGNEIDMDSMFKNDNQLFVLWISAKDCRSCTDIALSKIHENLKQSEDLRIVLFANYYIPRELSIMIRDYDIRYPVIIPSVNGSEVFKLFDEISNPMIFVFDKDYRVTAPHYIDKSPGNRLQVYLYAIRKKYFGND